MKLPVPAPQMNEFRRFYNHRDVPQEEVVTDPQTGEPSIKTVTIPTADYVSIQADHDPSDEEWADVLTANGFTSEEVQQILNGD